MSLGRRRFIKSVGVSLGSLVLSGALSGCRVGSENESTTTGPVSSSPEWTLLRQCWLDLNTLQEASTQRVMEAKQAGLDLWEADQAVPRERKANHQAVLDVLVRAGELDAPVAEQMQMAFEEAVYHLHRSMATCYMIFPYEMRVRGDLLEQETALIAMSDDLDPATVAQARAAIAQDMAYFEIIDAKSSDYKSIRQAYQAGALEASPETLEAARMLTELLLGTPD